jgi:phospholipase/lecithinase/hemolysin
MLSAILRHAAVFLILAGASARAVEFSGLIAFGDSLSDRGNTVAELYEVLNETDTYNSNFYDDGRWSNGPLWIEHVNAAFGFTTWERNDGNALSGGHDFAWGGSESGTGYTDDLLANLQTQIQYYQENVMIGPLVDPGIGTKLFSVWSGGNDVINAVQGGEPIDEDALTTAMASNIAAAVTTLYNGGGRHFIVPNLPDLGKKPNYRTNPFYAGEATSIVQLYNPKLAAQIGNLRATLPGITIYAFDAYTILNDVIANPSDYGFANVTQPAYVSDPDLPEGGYVNPDPDSYLFWDTTHPTRVGHAILAQKVLELINSAQIDTTAPQVTIKPVPRRTGKRILRIAGKASDDRALDRVEVKHGGRAGFKRAQGAANWHIRVRLQPGRNAIHIRAVDQAGNVSKRRKIVIMRVS